VQPAQDDLLVLLVCHPEAFSQSRRRGVVAEPLQAGADQGAAAVAVVDVTEAFIEDEAGNRIDTVLGPWECIACPPGVIHGYVNNSLEPVYFQVMLGKGRPDTMGYADEDLYRRRDAHLSR